MIHPAAVASQHRNIVGAPTELIAVPACSDAARAMRRIAPATLPRMPTSVVGPRRAQRASAVTIRNSSGRPAMAPLRGGSRGAMARRAPLSGLAAASWVRCW